LIPAPQTAELGLTRISHKGSFTYLYKIKSIWDPKKRRAKKVTEKYLGKVTEAGLVKPKAERLMAGLKEITVKEFGASRYVNLISLDIIELLKEHFSDYWKELYIFSVIRLFYSSPLKNVSSYYSTSHLSDEFPEGRVSAKSLSELLSVVGMKRGRVVEFLKRFVKGSEYEVIDLTHVFSYSENVISSVLGYNSERKYIPQINFVLVFSLDMKQPSFFRLVPGSIKDITVIPATLKEAGIENAVIIGDKGFCSENNLKFLEDNGLQYIIPLKRSSAQIDYSPIEIGNRRLFDGYFLFEKRSIWYSRKIKDKRNVLLFLDERLKAEEERDLLTYVDDGKFEIEKVHEIYHRLGTIGVITNTDFDGKKVFDLLKGRVEIEQVFDMFKNILHADRTYIRGDVEMHGWMLVNFISMLLYYRIYMNLVEKNLLNKFSVKDTIVHLSRIFKLKLNNEWTLSEIPKTSRIILNKLDFHPHIT
jgi:transposase